MTIAEQIRLLTEDPGANQLAKIVDQLQTQVNACCGGGINNVAGASESSKAPPEKTGPAGPQPK